MDIYRARSMFIFKVFQEFLAEHKALLAVYFVCTLLTFPLESVVLPQIYSGFFEALKGTAPDAAVFLRFFVWIAVVLLVVNGANFATNYIESLLIPQLSGFILNYMFRNLMEMNEANITDVELGKLISRMTTVPTQLKEFVSDICTWIFPRALTILVINIYFFSVSWKLGAFSVALLALLFYVNNNYFQKCSRLSLERHELFEWKAQRVQDKLNNSFSIYASGNLQEEIAGFETETGKYTSKFTDNLLCLNRANLITSAVLVLTTLGLNASVAYLFMQGELNHVQLMALFMMIIYYVPNITTINSTIPELVQLYGALNVIDDFIRDLYTNETTRETMTAAAPTTVVGSGDIRISDLTFGHTEGNPIFLHYDLHIRDQEKVAFRGPSGQGKSTLIKLIMGYYSVPPGHIFIDGRDIGEYGLSNLRKQIGFVNQSTKLFDMTLLENIQYGNGASREEIETLIAEMGVGGIYAGVSLDAPVGIEGNNLSGGQRQMVHILRCILRKNPIVVLDEPTSAIDRENRKHVIRAIRRLSEGRTVILITHDDELLSLVDRVVLVNAEANKKGGPSPRPPPKFA